MAYSSASAPTAGFRIATIWDWDLIIFAASHLNEAIEASAAAVAAGPLCTA